ncbi:PREDICTED: X-ray radiation resistance-associated protein 1 [Charadrius vociferus]|uniref:X-ray radiation resistance-associated protein 1 n=1 Tax=Charadrius vociferus TaxID=50402 RepID=UPI000521C673|nr:PREDICTED: X-ray radiation resistance-associated protein 1 [Charadrius vociferus]
MYQGVQVCAPAGVLVYPMLLPSRNAAVKMPTTGVYKMGDESNYGTNCFPARNILRASKEGSGRWMLAHRATPRTWTEKGTTRKTPQQRRKPPESASVEENNEGNVLDELFLMKHHRLKNPSDLCSVNISSQNLVSAKEDDFEKFDCLAFINAAENLLTLEPFRKFPGLRELELSLNGLRNLKITAGDFLHLEDLDLSYNNLSPQDIWTLGDLSQLKVLRLTANGLRSLPPDLAGSWDSAHLRFPSLEVLLLDDNRLSDPSVFVSLSHLCSFSHISSSVPYLHQAESQQFFLHPVLDGDSFRAECYKSLSSLWQRPRPPQQEDMEVPAELEEKKGQLEYVVLWNNRDPGRTEVIFNSGSQERPLPVNPREGDLSASKTLPAPSMRRDVCAPFPELKCLSLAFNKIADETALLPVAFFPCLKELMFHNNPLTTTRSGQLPLLTQLLQHSLGIKLVRQKNLAVKRQRLSIPLKANRKVTSHLPKVTKRPLMLEAPAKAFLWKQLPAVEEAARDAAYLSLAHPLPPISSATPASSWRTALEEGEGNSRPPPGSAEEDIPSFFMTQVEDESRPLLRPAAEGRLEKSSEQRPEGSSQVVPEQYKGYEELLRGDTDPDLMEPVAIQKNMQPLYYILTPSLVYQDAKPRLDIVQKPYVPQKKHGRMPSPPARKTKSEVLEGILMAMRNTSTITEVPLASVLQKRKSNPRAYREARRLMEEFQEVFEILPATLGKEMAKLSDEAHVVEALLMEATSEQGNPEQLQLPGKTAAKKMPKV